MSFRNLSLTLFNLSLEFVSKLEAIFNQVDKPVQQRFLLGIRQFHDLSLNFFERRHNPNQLRIQHQGKRLSSR